MARLGRGQPRQPIFLRGAAAAVVVLAALPPQIHVVSQARAPRPAATHIIRLRAPLPPALPQPFHIVLARPAARSTRSRTPVVVLRNPQAPAVVVATPAPPIHVLLARPIPARLARATHVRPSRSSFVPDRLPPQLHLVLAAPSAFRRPSRPANVVVERNPQVPPAVVAGPAPQIHVVTVRVPPVRAVRVTYVRPSRSSFVPDRLPPQVRVVQALPVPRAARRTAIVASRTPVAPAAVPAPQIHVVRVRARTIRANTLAYVRPSRTSLVPPRLAPQVHVVQPAYAGFRRPSRPAYIIQVSNPPPDFLPGEASARNIFVVPGQTMTAAAIGAVLHIVPPAPATQVAGGYSTTHIVPAQDTED